MISITIEQVTEAESYVAKHLFDRVFIGDLLLGEKYVQPKIWMNEHLLDNPYIWLDMVANNPWTSLKILGIDFKEFRDDVAYQCEHDEAGNTYYWMVPRVIIPSSSDTWKKHMKEPKIPGCAMDYEFHRATNWGFRKPEDRQEALKQIHIHPHSNSIPGVMMGHGYAPGFTPYDGSPHKIATIVRLSDGSDMICSCWAWCNK